MRKILYDARRQISPTFTVQYVSDLHLETKKSWDRYIVPDSPNLILAGDVAPAFNPKLPLFYSWCKENFENVIHVPGNHEYAHTTIEDGDSHLQQLCSQYDILFGQRTVFELAPEIDIICATLWTNIPNRFGKRNDFAQINDFNPASQRSIFRRDVEFINDSLDYCLDNQHESIVVTHHPPIDKGVTQAKYTKSRYRAAYVNRLYRLAAKANTWIFGHTHHVCDVQHGSTLITSNPIGHLREKLSYNRTALLEITRN